MFIDKVTVSIAAGDGGDGVVSWRHEKYVDRGGPDGGDGGRGGSVIAVASDSENTLARFRYDKRIAAEPGKNGSKRKKHGRSAPDLLVKLPVGTVVTRDGEVIADLTVAGEEVVLARGGGGGFGNAHFVSSIRRAPKIAERGEPGETFEAVFELKSIADVGVIGLPNAGKSTFLSVVSNAKPEIANYQFTTLIPNLGVVDIDKEHSLLLADIPGLIEGASEGKGLGHEFLRHVERTKVLLHLIDAYENDVAEAYRVISGELAAYSKTLAKRARVVALTKIEGLDAEIIAMQIAQLTKVVPKGTPVVAVSSLSGEGVKELLYTLSNLVKAERDKKPKKKAGDGIPVIRPDFQEEAWRIEKTANGFIIHGKKIEKFAVRTRFDDEFSLTRLRDIMKKMGIMRELRRQGLSEGSVIQIGDSKGNSFEY